MKSTFRPSPAAAIAVVALVFAMVGGAIALPGKNKVDSGDLKKGSVTKKAIAKNAVTSKALKDGAVKGTKLADSAVDSSKLAGAAVDSSKLADSSVTSAKVKDGEITAADLAAGTVPQQAFGRVNKSGATVTVVAGGTGILGATNDGGGIICYDLAFVPTSGTATVVHENIAEPGPTVEALLAPDAAPGCDAETFTKGSDTGTLTDEDVYVQFIK